MANYCKKCGCYIPDGKSSCLACGYDEAVEAKRIAEEQAAAARGKGFFSHKTSSSASAAAYAPEPEATTGGGEPGEYHGKAGNVEWGDGEAWRREADMKREQRQQWERWWAETEHRRREMENEFKRKQAAEGTRSSAERRTSYRVPGSTVRKTDEDQNERPSSNSFAERANSSTIKKVLIVLSYLSAMCFLPMFLYRDDDFAQFHAKQGLILFLYGLVADALGAIPLVGTVLLLGKLYFIYRGMMNALSGKKETLPIIGKILK